MVENLRGKKKTHYRENKKKRFRSDNFITKQGIEIDLGRIKQSYQFLRRVKNIFYNVMTYHNREDIDIYRDHCTRIGDFSFFVQVA